MVNPFENFALNILLLGMTSVAAIFDIRTHKIPNLLTFPAILLALCYYTVEHGWAGFLFSAGGLGAGIALLLLPYLMGGMGAGDAKLMGAIGACLGAERTLVAFLFIAPIGCLYALMVVILQRHRFKGYFKQLWLTAQAFMLTRKYVPIESATEAYPKVYYGTAIAAGTIIFMIMEINGIEILI
jgi:prepilin peptidase CpaA